VEKIVCIIFFAAVLITGCAAESTVSVDQIWPDDKYMTRLEQEAHELCSGLIKGITPGRRDILRLDNFHPRSPLLSEAYVVVSMLERMQQTRMYEG